MVDFPNEQTANMSQIQDHLTGALIGLARATDGNEHMITDSTAEAAVEGLFATMTNVSCDQESLLSLLDRADQEKRKLVPSCYICASPCGRTSNYDMKQLWNVGEDVRSLKSLILFGIRGIAAYAHYAAKLGYRDSAVHQFLYKGLFAIGMDDWDTKELLPIVQEAGEMHIKCMAMLNRAIATTYGHPQPTPEDLKEILGLEHHSK